MAVGYMGAIEKFDEVIMHSNAKNPDIAALAEGLKLFAQAVRNDPTKIEREAGRPIRPFARPITIFAR